MASVIKKILLHYYFSIRTWWPFWFFILNARARALFSKHRPTLNQTQKNIAEELGKSGIAVTSLEELFPEKNLLEELRHYAEEIEGSISSPETKKKFLLEYWPLKPLLNTANPFLQFTLSHTLRDIVNTYMNMFTRMKYYHLAKTIPVPPGEAPVQSQRWHRDPEEKRMCKVFIYLSDVDEGSGPFMYVPQSVYGKKWGHLFPQKTPEGIYPPEGAVEKIIPQKEIKTMTGKAGTVIFCDTTGIHRGGYAVQNERIMFTAFYTSSTYSDKPSYIKPENFSLPPELNTKSARYALHLE
jgi:hypothetical protein